MRRFFYARGISPFREFDAMARRHVNIAVGDLFEKTNSTKWRWQVRELITPAGHRPHARLVRFDHPSEARLFSLSALYDRRLFVPAS